MGELAAVQNGDPRNDKIAKTLARIDDATAVAIAARLMGLLDGLELEREKSSA